jgi:glycosyltransferase involved in cell wall biosynthesis
LLDDLKRQAADLDLAPEVIDFRGGVKDVAKIYSEVDILVLTSDWEGSPNVVLEAMSSGIPVVSTRVGGVPDLVQHRVTGLLVESDDERALADAVLTFIAEPELRRELAANARRFVEQHHSLGCLPTVLGEVYEAAFQNLPLDRVSSREPSPR